MGARATARSACLAILWVAVALIVVVLALSLWSIPFGTESYHPEDAGIGTMYLGVVAAAISVLSLVFALILRAVKLIGWTLPVVMLCLLVAAGACAYAGNVTHENTCNTDDYTRYRCGID